MYVLDTLTQFNIYHLNDYTQFFALIYLFIANFFFLYAFNITFWYWLFWIMSLTIIFITNTINFTFIITISIIGLLFYQIIGTTFNSTMNLALDLLKMILKKIYETIPVQLNIFNLFLLILCFLLLIFNLIGLLPYSTAITSHFIFAFYFSITFFLVNIIIGLICYNVKFFELFLPDNVPFWIIPMLLIIELISFISRVFSLAIRLFANIVAGHILLKILISFIYLIISTHLSLAPVFVLGILGISLIIVLELFIGFLQVYIFILLLIIYMGSIINLH